MTAEQMLCREVRHLLLRDGVAIHESHEPAKEFHNVYWCQPAAC
jgi:hypothetical protein